MARNVVVLGSTGSIGRQTLDVVRSSRGAITVFGLATYRNAELLAEQAREFLPRVVALEIPVQKNRLEGVPPTVETVFGEGGLADLVTHPDVDIVVIGSAGKGGLLPTLAALKANKRVAMANKETLVMAGSIIQKVLATGKGSLVPIDSEHSAIWQCLQGEPDGSVESLTLTSSGGALRNLPKSDLSAVTPEQALRHPTWTMGRKITIDSATLMNKGLEAIEARWLFDVPLESVEIVLHTESIVHSLVTFNDGSVKAQLGLPDMRLPIQYALSHPHRWPADLPRLNLADVGSLHFAPVDLERYPALSLALRAGRAGGTYPAVLSAADEVAVDAFLNGKIGYTNLPDIVDATLQDHVPSYHPEIDVVLEADCWARTRSKQLVATQEKVSS